MNLRSQQLPASSFLRFSGLVSALVLGLLVSLPVAATQDQHGTTHDVLGPSGQYTILDFAASWCTPCRRSLPLLEEWAEENPEVRVLVINEDRSLAGRDRLIQMVDLDLPVIWDQGHAIAQQLRPKAIPETVVLDPEGREIHRHTGFSERLWAEFVEYLETLPTAEGSSPEGKEGGGN